jgi:ABC-type polysaccharide/polyol phosphate transport system ATPase subunit
MVSPIDFHPASENPEVALVVSDATFKWPEVSSLDVDDEEEGGDKGKKKKNDEDKKEKKKDKKEQQVERANTDSTLGASSKESKPNETAKDVKDLESTTKVTQLQDINLQLKRGSLTVVVGKVGCGKSSLLHSIVGDMEKKQGSVNIYGQLSFSPQTPWLQNATIRDNILFGKPMDETRYREVVRVCSLLRDFEILGDGDLSEVGEKGVTLSGGQAARVNLARAVYAESDLLLLVSGWFFCFLFVILYPMQRSVKNSNSNMSIFFSVGRSPLCRGCPCLSRHIERMHPQILQRSHRSSCHSPTSHCVVCGSSCLD